MNFHPLQYEFIKNELIDIVGRDRVLTHEADRINYSVDYFWVPRMLIDRGQTPPMPDYVVLPETTQEIARIIKRANQYRIPVLPWGGGSGSQGGVMPVHAV